ncbi:MAG: VWA domain-containing protein [Verrucomicrobiae bacterium]|nr:VWA domain-containing protein [Verrucomicrobiae bacterium]
MRFLHPELLWLLALLPLLALLKGRKGAAAALEYSSVELVRGLARARSAQAGAWLSTLRLLALALLIVALARPQFGRGTAEVQASGIDIVLTLDVSSSMEARDFQVGGHSSSRVEVVKSVVGDFIQARPNDRIALIAFAGRPYLISPLTLDHDWLQQNLERIRVGLIEDSTAIGSAIGSSVNRLRDQKSKSKIVILLTDGMNNAGKILPAAAADAARALGIKIYTIGVGSKGEVPIPVRDTFGRQVMVTAKVDMDEDTLRSVAEKTGGQYYRATDTDSLRQIYAQIDRLEKTTIIMKKFEQYEELFAWALIPGLLLLALEILLANTWLRRLP